MLSINSKKKKIPASTLATRNLFGINRAKISSQEWDSENLSSRQSCHFSTTQRGHLNGLTGFAQSATKKEEIVDDLGQGHPEVWSGRSQFSKSYQGLTGSRSCFFFFSFFLTAFCHFSSIWSGFGRCKSQGLKLKPRWRRTVFRTWTLRRGVSTLATFDSFHIKLRSSFIFSDLKESKGERVDEEEGVNFIIQIALFSHSSGTLENFCLSFFSFPSPEASKLDP